MQLITKATVPGQWVVVSGANPQNIDPSYVTIGEVRQAAYVDGNQYRVRCPQIASGTVEVSVGGTLVGSLIVRNQ